MFYDKGFQLMKKDLVSYLAVYSLFSAPFWIGLFIFLTRIVRPGKNIVEQMDFLLFMSVFLSAGLALVLMGKIYLTLFSTQNFLGNTTSLRSVMDGAKGRLVTCLSVASFFIALSFITLFMVIPSAFFLLAASLCIPFILIEEEGLQHPMRCVFSTIFNNLFFLIKLILTGMIIFIVIFINFIYGIYFALAILGFFHIVDMNSIGLRLSSPYYVLFCLIITFFAFDFFWTICHTVYYFYHSSEKTGKDLLVRLKNIEAHEELT
ncbi:MAG: hypothetical protein JW928_00620 [Candidatus Aureabacteria bacterium]|nr:hypothetical protein [Candidatus Auribacterota bacterium]